MNQPIRMTQAPEVHQQSPQSTRVAPLDTSVIHPDLRLSIDMVRGEVDDAFAQLKTFHNQEPDWCMRVASGHSARLSELAVQIGRIEDWAQEWKRVRQRELEPCIAEIRSQYEIASRRHTVREHDWKTEMGER